MEKGDIDASDSDSSADGSSGYSSEEISANGVREAGLYGDNASAKDPAFDLDVDFRGCVFEGEGCVMPLHLTIAQRMAMLIDSA